MLSIAVVGAFGKMGAISCQTLESHPEFNLVAQLGRGDSVQAALTQHQPDVLLDFTLPDCVYGHAATAIGLGVRPVVGASGLTVDQIERLRQLCEAKALGAMVVPNFSVGAILMMHFSQQAAHYLSDMDIVELHHDKKVDAPSGTARKTAEVLSPSQQNAPYHIASTPN